MTLALNFFDSPPNTPAQMDEIPANPIDHENLQFSPIEFSENSEKKGKEGEKLHDEEGVIDEEISFTKRFSHSTEIKSELDNNMTSDNTESVITESDNITNTTNNTDNTTNNTDNITNTTNIADNLRLQRKSDEDICNTPKRERHEDESLNRRFTRQLQDAADNVQENLRDSVPTTPQKSKDQLVRSLSSEFEQRLASIHVSPVAAANNNGNGAVKNSSRSMSPIRSIAQLSPVSKLNLNDDNTEEQMKHKEVDDATTSVLAPKLVSPSKIVAAASVLESEKIKAELEAKWSKQVEFMQFEVASLQEKYESSLKSNAEMRTMLAEYEKTLAQFIDARRTRPDQHSSLDQLLQDKKKLELEIQTLQISYQNLHQRYEDLRGLQEQARINDATLRQSIQVLQQELASTVRNLENTRRLYEDKIEKINTEAKSTKDSLEYELSATKAKLLKSELKISSLESAIETKTRENSELMTICDELIHKMDKRCT